MRTDDDQWGIAESVGATALAVASARAIETQRADGLVSDPYAASFVRAAADELALPTGPSGDGQDGDWTQQAAYVGVRSRFFDQALTDAAASGIRQVVLLAAGLDTRALRLDWPAGTVVYEIDQRGVLAFKDGVLGDTGSRTRVEVPVDLRHDWPAALRAAGFDPTRPTAWLAEGLLPYLPAQAEADLFDRVQQLSVPGSRIAVEHFALTAGDLTVQEGTREMGRRLGVDVGDLIYHEERTGPDDRLRALGWTVDDHGAGDLAASWGRPLEGPLTDIFRSVRLLDATLTG